MALRSLFMLGLVAVSSTSFAAADLSVSIAMPTGVYVYQTASYLVTVANVGNQTAANSSVVIQLPVTNTYPVYTMGTVGTYSSSCTRSGSVLTCALGEIKKNKSTSVSFNFTLPESTNPLVIGATASTTSNETVLSNNVTSGTAALLNYSVSFTAPRDLLNEHCTGTNLSSYYECTLFPSSISSHETTLNADYTISFGGGVGPEYTGIWSQASSDHLAFTYFEYGVLVAEFEGYGVNSTCWEGMTEFPGSSYMSMYRVCLQ